MEKNGLNGVHDKRVAGCIRGPNIHHWLLVAVEEKLLPRPQVTPQATCKSNGV